MNSTRTPGQRPDWCLDLTPEEDHAVTKDGRLITTWTRYFMPPGVPWGIYLLAEDWTNAEGYGADDTVIRICDPERPLTFDEAEQFAQDILEAVKVGRGPQSNH